MNDKETPADKAPAIAPKEKAPAQAKTWKYIGPAKAPLISNLPGTGQAWHADELPQQYIQFVIDTVPAAKYWYE
jgi:hypothetical protein